MNSTKGQSRCRKPSWKDYVRMVDDVHQECAKEHVDFRIDENNNIIEPGYCKKMLAEPVPLQIRNAETKLMKDLGYGKGYKYAHDYEEKLTAMSCLPDSIKDKEYYLPTDQGNEARYKERLEQIKEWKKNHRK